MEIPKELKDGLLSDFEQVTGLRLPDDCAESLKKRFNVTVSNHLPQHISVPFQKCPKCDGQGTVSKPPYVPGDVNQWSSTSATFQCDVCNGQKIIPQMVLPKSNEEGT